MNHASRRHVLTARVFAWGSVLLLAFLFVVPSRQVRTLRETILPLADAVTEAVVVAEDWEAARRITAEMVERCAAYDRSLRLYFNHEDVNSLRTRILACYNLARAEDGQIVADLEDAKNDIRYLESIESFTLWNLF